MNNILKIYNEKFALWTQLAGCIGIFGSFFVVIWEIPAYKGLPMISIWMFIIGAILCTINKFVDDNEFNKLYSTQENELQEKINKGELPPERLDLFRRMFKK